MRELMHHGTPHDGPIPHSGRYPWGSGDSYKYSKSLVGQIKALKAKGMTDSQVAEHLGMSTRELIAKRSLANSDIKRAELDYIRKQKEKGVSTNQIAKDMGRPESSIRYMLKEGYELRANELRVTADALKKAVDDSDDVYFDVGSGVATHLGISNTRMLNALDILKDEGYSVQTIYVPNLGTDDDSTTTVKVLAKPDTTRGDILRNLENVSTLPTVRGVDGIKAIKADIEVPESLSSKRLAVRYGPDGGADYDGYIELRPGVSDISMGSNHYSQVRILVDGTHFIKGMAVYNPDLPDGVDVRFNTDKSDTGNKLDALKTIDPAKKRGNNPFGSSIASQTKYKDSKGNERLSAINIVSGEGTWDNWSSDFSSQFLSKQPKSLVKKQLELTAKLKEEELDDILAYKNPVVRKSLLMKYADSADADAMDLQAISLPGTKTRVLIPMPHLKPGEVYAPQYENGTVVSLVRHPHAGPFEIPELVVNNKSTKSRKIIPPNSLDAIGIRPETANKLSGADFDGDTVLVIPNNKGAVKSSRSLKGLEGFNPKTEFPTRKGMKRMTQANTQKQMGIVSNLITDMDIAGASEAELARAVRHSMVVIDAEKHGLDYKRSEEYHDIKGLKKKYQRSADGTSGAATIVSRAKSPVYVNRRRLARVSEGGPINKETGEKNWVDSGRKGKKKSYRMLETKDAMDLVSVYQSPIEKEYAAHANKLKALANKARKAYVNTPNHKYDREANKRYSKEVEYISKELKKAEKNQPIERVAQSRANARVNAIVSDYPQYANDRGQLRKLNAFHLDVARSEMGARRHQIDITPNVWKAVEAGAISNNMLESLVRYADPDQIKKYTFPREGNRISDAKQRRIKTLKANGYTIGEIASAVGVSTSTVNEYVN